jgi:hypothetical protein
MDTHWNVRPSRPWARLVGPVIAAAALHVGLMALYVAAYGGDVSALFCTSQALAGRPPYEAIRVSFPSAGYDGQYYYALARAPWSLQNWDGRDNPAFRQVRILYPTLGWLLSAGNAALLVWALPAINLAAIAAMALLGAHVALRRGLSPWWGFALPLAVSAGLPALRDLTDPLSTLAALGLLAGWLLGWRGRVLVLWAAAALFSREQNLAVVGAVLAAALWARRPRLALGLVGAIALWGAWVGLLWVGYGRCPFASGGGFFDWPLVGMGWRWSHLEDRPGSHASAVVHLLAMSHLTVLLLLALGLTLSRTDWTLKAVLLCGAAMAVLGGQLWYMDLYGYERVFVFLPLGIWLAAIQARRRWLAWLLTPGGLWPLVTILQAWHVAAILRT